jgi:hypothetical protein
VRRGPAIAAAAGGVTLISALWLTWFSRRLSSVFAPVRAVRSVSGWGALGAELGVILVAVAVMAVAWGLVGRSGAGKRRPSGAWLVGPGALALVIEVGLAVARIGADERITTVPAPGLVVALVASLAILLAGLAELLARPVRQP